MFRIFIDECGHADLKSSEHPNERYLGLTGVIMRLEYESGEFTNNLNKLKEDIFGTRNIVLHRKEIVGAVAPFECLRDENIRSRFNTQFLPLLSESTFRVFSVIIDKKEHKQRYAVWRFDPYHYCLTVMLERYVMFLDRIGQSGDVMAESRGKKDNMRLERAYKYIYANGSEHVSVRHFQQHLSSREIKIQPKTANISGLQIADAIANPCYRALICEKTNVAMQADFGKRVVETLLRNKFLKSPYGKIKGWGTKILP